MQRLTGVTVIGVICFLYGGYLGAAAMSMLLLPGPQSLLPSAEGLAWVPRFLPYVASLAGLGWILIGGGLLHSRNWARWAVIIAAGWGEISSLRLLYYSYLWSPFLLVALQIMVRVVVVFYLLRSSVARQFAPSRKPV